MAKVMLIVALAGAAVVLLLAWAAARAPACRCGDVDCGGGCIPSKRRR